MKTRFTILLLIIWSLSFGQNTIRIPQPTTLTELSNTIIISNDYVYDLYNDYADALFARMPIQPTPTRKTLINNLITSLVDGGYWDRLDNVKLLAGHDSASCLLNIININHTGVAYDSVTFTEDRGFTGNSYDSSYIDDNYNPYEDAVHFTKNRGSIFTYMNSNIVEDHKLLYGESGGGTLTLPATGNIIRTDLLQWKVNEGTGAYGEHATGGRQSGLMVATRNDTLLSKLYFNGYLQDSCVVCPTGSQLADTTTYILSNGVTNFNSSDNTIALTGIGDWFNEDEQLELFDIFYTYINAIGASDTRGNDTIMYQTFEGTGYSDHERFVTVAGTPDPDYTTTVLSGSQSLNMPTGASISRYTPEYTDTTHLQFMVRIPDVTPGGISNILAGLSYQAAAQQFSVRLLTTGKLMLYSAGTSVVESSATLIDNTTYYMWVDHIMGTGTDAKTDLYVNTISTKPETATLSIANGTGVLRIGRIRIYSTSDGNAIFDNIIVTK